jgi:alanyl-tRNA synthetase
MTNKLYYTSPYLKEWRTNIDKVVEKDGKILVVLSETAFYPEGGGQPSDKGYINDIEVLHVFEEDDIIYHEVSSKPVSNEAHCRLDYERRFDLMQQHSGQHVLSAVFYASYEGVTAGFHLGEDYVTIDIALPELSEETLRDVELKANQHIFENAEVKTYIITPEEVEKLALRKLPKVDENIRIVEMVDIDLSPCCGTHVTRTGEIGLLKILKSEKNKGMTRIYFKCGKRALLDYQNKQEVTTTLSRHLSEPEQTLVTKVEAVTAELKNITWESGKLKEALSKYEAQELLQSSDSKLISKVFENKSFDEIQGLAKQVLLSGDYVTIFSSVPDKKVLLGYSGNFDLHCGKIYKEHVSSYSGRGGGGDKQAQAGFASVEDMNAFGEFLYKKIKDLI